ncbi:MAG: hypothetical protein SGBAC_008566 [Bacillariaceae sp.]
MPSFPYNLHTLVEAVSADEELCTIISWLPDGKSFRIHSLAEFEKRVWKKYFPKQDHVKSFMRQLQYYNFENFGDGLFCHPCFRQGQRNLCGQILHQLPTKSQMAFGKSTRPLKARGRKKKARSQPWDSSPEPSMAPYTVIPSSTEPSIPDDATSSSVSTFSSSGADEQQSLQQVRDQETAACAASPTLLGSATAAHLFNSAALPMLPLQASSTYMPPSVLAHYEMQAVSAARNDYLSCLQQDLMIGSILYGKRRLSMKQ